MQVRKRYVFTGCVQGVGFRFRAYHVASLMGLTGWVRNEYDGSVTMEVQGEQNDINAMVGLIENGHYIDIENMESKELPADLSENSFEIRN